MLALPNVTTRVDGRRVHVVKDMRHFVSMDGPPIGVTPHSIVAFQNVVLVLRGINVPQGVPQAVATEDVLYNPMVE